MVLICLFLCLSVSLSLFFFPPSSSAYAPILISISSIVLRLISSSLFPSRLHPLPVFQSRRVPPALALPLLFSSFLFFSPSSSSSGLTTSQSYPLPCFSRSLYVFCLCPDLHSPSLPLAIFLHLELSLSCLFSISRPSVNPSGTPSLSYLSFSSGHSISPRFTRSCFTSPILFPFLVLFRSLNLASPLLLLGAVLLCSRCSARRKYSLFAPPLIWLKRQFVLF